MEYTYKYRVHMYSLFTIQSMLLNIEYTCTLTTLQSILTNNSTQNIIQSILRNTKYTCNLTTIQSKLFNIENICTLTLIQSILNNKDYSIYNKEYSYEYRVHNSNMKPYLVKGRKMRTSLRKVTTIISVSRAIGPRST